MAEVWFIDPDSGGVLVVRRSAAGAGFDVAVELTEGDLLTSPLLPGFDVRVGSLFER